MQLNKNIKYFDKPISKIILGTATAPFMSGKDCNAILDNMLAAGINTIDTARNYALAEASIGKWLTERNNREQVVIISKGGHPSVFGRKRINEVDVRKDLEKSLKLLNTSYIDIYMLHRDDPSISVEEIMNFMNKFIDEGKIKAIGVSNWNYNRIKEANDYAIKKGLKPIVVSSPHYSLAIQVNDPWDGTCETITGDEHVEDRKYYEESQIPVIAFSSLGRGLLTGKVKSNELDNISENMDANARKGYAYSVNFRRLARCEEIASKKNATVPQIALAYLFNNKMDVYAVVSMSSNQRIIDNLKSLDINLTEEEILYLEGD